VALWYNTVYVGLRRLGRLHVDLLTILVGGLLVHSRLVKMIGTKVQSLKFPLIKLRFISI
jgi:hypothetical protein